jgi:hypothetical protein
MTMRTYPDEVGWDYILRTIGVLLAIAIAVALFYYYSRSAY